MRQGSAGNPGRRRHVVGGPHSQQRSPPHLRAAPAAIADHLRRPYRARPRACRPLARAMPRHRRFRSDALIPARWAASEPTPLDPRAVQLASGADADAHTAWVGPASHWAGAACHATNPMQRAAAVADYAVQLAGRPDLIMAARAELAGQDLGWPFAAAPP